MALPAMSWITKYAVETGILWLSGTIDLPWIETKILPGIPHFRGLGGKHLPLQTVLLQMARF
jgi:hypothetical protein